MRRWIAVLAMLLQAMQVAGEETAPKDSPKKPASEEMVQAAKESKARRKKSALKVITNADVKKSKAKLIMVAAPASPNDKKAASAPTSLQEQETRRKQRLASEDLVGVAEKKVAGLERSVEELEQQYYRENDPTYRDSVIRDRFNQARRQLDDARRELADARDTLNKYVEPTP